MKEIIEKTELLKGQNLVTVRFVPGWFRRLFRVKETTQQFLDSGREYLAGGDTKWLSFPSMEVFGRYPELDRFVRQKEITG